MHSQQNTIEVKIYLHYSSIYLLDFEAIEVTHTFPKQCCERRLNICSLHVNN